MRKRLYALIMAGVLLLVIANCGEKFSLPSDLPKPDYSTGGVDTSYLQVNPVWTSAGGINFNHPFDISIGYDQYIYVCDTKNNRIVKLDLEGDMIESYAIKNPVAVTQDRGLDLLAVCGDYDEKIQRDSVHIDTVAYGNAVYRKLYLSSDGFEVAWRAVSPYGFITTPGGTIVFYEAEFWGIAASKEPSKEYFLADADYNIARGRILRFNKNDEPVFPPLIEDGTSIGRTRYPCDLFMYEIAGREYLASAQGYGNLGVQVFSPVNGQPLFNDTTITLPAMIRFSSRVFKDVAVDEFSNFYVFGEPDPTLGTNYYFYKFDRYGDPLLAFGSTGSGERQFRITDRGSGGIDYLNGVVYIADTGNNRIVRYQLSTDTRR